MRERQLTFPIVQPRGLKGSGGILSPKREIIRCPAILHEWEENEQSPLEAIGVTSLGASNTGASGSTVTLTGVTVPAGATIVVCVADGDTTGTSSTCADGTNGSYTGVLATGLNNAPATFGYIKAFYFQNSAALSGATITYTPHGSGNFVSVSALYATGLRANSYDSGAANAATGNGFSASVTSGSPSVGGELFVGFSANNTSTASQGSAPWATPPVGWSSWPCIGGNQVNAGAGALTYDASANNGAWASLIMTFMPIVVPGAPPRRIVRRRYH